jgi:hypothetical protein
MQAAPIPRYSLVWKLAMLPKVPGAPCSLARPEWGPPTYFGSAAKVHKLARQVAAAAAGGSTGREGTRAAGVAAAAAAGGSTGREGTRAPAVEAAAAAAAAGGSTGREGTRAPAVAAGGGAGAGEAVAVV